MRNGLIISVLLHGLVLVYALGYLPFGAPKDVPPPRPVPVDLVTPSEFTKIKAGRKEAKKDRPAKPVAQKKPKSQVKTPAKKQAKKVPPKKSKPKKKRVVAKRAPKKSAPAPAKKVKPVKSAQKKVAPARVKPVKKVRATKAKVKPKAKPKPKKVAKVAPRPAAKPKSKPKPVARKVRRSYEDEMAALLNKLPDDSVAAPAGPLVERKAQARSQEVGRGRLSGFDTMMSASEIDAFRAQVARCWNPPVGGLGAGALAVKLRLQLRRNGAIARPPKLMNRQASPFFQAAADSAIRAVLQCQPYTMPKNKYDTWRDMVLTFDPREMMGGF